MVLVAASGCADRGADTAEAEVTAGSVEWKIENARSAAPEGIARDATIMDWPVSSASSPIVLREGTNGWVCYPASADVPVDDPMCQDEVASVWSEAVRTGQVPAINTIGVGYMLAGGASASLADPGMRAPPEGEEWRIDPPHFTLHFPPGALESSGLPDHPDVGGPWVMWASTPWAHIMVPVGPAPTAQAPDSEPGTPEWDTWNAQSAAPVDVSGEATIVTWATGAGSEPSILRNGTNGWTCFPASPNTPADDPTCGNEVWRTWFQAWASKTIPDLHGIGFSYWLKPSLGASNDDPSLMVPNPGQDWIPHPPELSVHLSNALLSMAAFSSDQDKGGPWIMYAETSYAHLMVPIR